MTYDALVVGAGIAGLVAAIRLQHAGLTTVVVERSGRAGGLCGTFEDDGFEFVIGCNDFGTGFERLLAALGVDIAFHHPRARFHFGPRPVELPPSARTLGYLALRLPALVRALRGARSSDTLGELIDHHISDPWLADLACLPAYAMMRSPDDVALCALRADFSKELGYGYDKSCTPVGGPQALVERMLARFAALGGTLLLDHPCLETRRLGDLHAVRTRHGEIRSRSILSSEGRWREYPPEAKPGLEVGLVLLVAPADRYPAGFHTVDWFAPGVASMLRRLDSGERVDAPSFHSFRPDLPQRDGLCTVNVFVPLARDERDPPPSRRRTLVAHVRQTLGRLLPGFEGGVRRATFMSPDEYEARFGLRPRPSPRILPFGVEKPKGYDPQREVHFIGTSVDPPGEHAGAAALSGWRAAEEVIRTRGPTMYRPALATGDRIHLTPDHGAWRTQ